MSIHDVRYFDSQMTGAPVKDGINAAGKLLQIFDACLVNGFNVRAVTQIVVSDGIATATTADADHGYRDYTVIRVWGCTENALNGDWKSSVVAGNTFSWPTTVANGTYGGTISAKTAPLGWSKPFSDTNIGVYRPGAGLRHYFRVNDTVHNYALVRGYENAASATDTGVQPFPTVTQMANGGGIHKTSNTSYKNRWTLFGDDRTMFFVFAAGEDSGVLTTAIDDYALSGFGELNSFAPAESASFIAASLNPTRNAHNGLNFPGYDVNDTIFAFGGFYISRPWSQITGAPTRLRCAGSALANGWGSASRANNKTPTPNPTDGALLFHHPVLVSEETSGAVRGELPGLWQPLNAGSLASVGSVFTINGRQILIVRAPDAQWVLNSTSDRAGIVGFDITGPWR